MYERTCGVRPHILRRPFRIGTVVFRPIAFFGWSRDFFFFFLTDLGGGAIACEVLLYCKRLKAPFRPYPDNCVQVPSLIPETSMMTISPPTVIFKSGPRSGEKRFCPWFGRQPYRRTVQIQLEDFRQRVSYSVVHRALSHVVARN